jgi:hypothetical protein
MVLVDHAVRQSHARHHDERARGQHRRGESAVLGQLAEVPHGLDSCPAPFYLAGMSSLRSRIRVPAKKQPRSWAVTLIKNRGVFLGFVEAPDQKAAELMAAKTFMLSEWQRKRCLSESGISHGAASAVNCLQRSHCPGQTSNLAESGLSRNQLGETKAFVTGRSVRAARSISGRGRACNATQAGNAA